ncbi:hypothetical protein [Rhodoblastus sp.]|uniref:hypothetical protein n=1 Tax=Rhodoblastus sp. TaxID=1962975 RepID=UPI0035B378C9
MKNVLVFTIALGLAGAPYAASAETRHHPTPAPAVQAQPAEQAPGPSLKPYAHPGDGDNDGLSRDPDDCNKGCIGGNPG